MDDPGGLTHQCGVSDGVRLDKWLWAVRVYKTRTVAAEACRAGHVRLNGEVVKPSREVRPGDLLTARTGDLTRTVRVVAPLEMRVAAARVPEFLEDLTPPEERERRRETEGLPMRPAGSGRPTKRDRRRLEAWLELPPPAPEV